MEIYRVDLRGLKELARKIASRLKGNEVIFLKGDLGAGKTTFVKFLVQALQPTEEVQVRSPTFAVMNVYPTRKCDVYHLDLYRVKRFDITDYLGSGILLVEWPEYLEDIEPDVVISFKPLDENTREVIVNFKKN